MQAIEHGLRALIDPGRVFEVRILKTRRATVSGYFDDIAVAAKAVVVWDGQAPGIYTTVNPVNPVLLARSNNHLREYADTATADADIVRRTRLYIDIDPTRPAGMSSTDQEHDAALTRAQQIIGYLSSLGWRLPLFVDSGNGAQVDYAIDLPNDLESKALVEGVLKRIASKFDDDKVVVDTTSANAARIVKISGTLACKGDSTPDRPHRRSRIISRPEAFELVTREQLLEVVAQHAPQGKSRAQGSRPSSNGSGDTAISQFRVPDKRMLTVYNNRLDAEEWLTCHGIPILRVKSTNGGRLYEIPCPGSHEGYDPSDGKAFVWQCDASGGLFAGCHHDSCSFSRKTGNHWRELRERRERRKAWVGSDGKKLNGASENRVSGDADSWLEPEPLGGELPLVEALHLELLPKAFRPLVQDVSERMQIPPDLPGALAILAEAGVTNRRAVIQPKAIDTSWLVVPNLFGGVVAPPGFMKSPAIKAITCPLTRIEAQWRGLYETELRSHQEEEEEADLRRSVWREQFKNAQKNGKPSPRRPEKSSPEPVCSRLITQDATMAKLHELLSENPAGMLVIRDELSSWWTMLDKPGREGERGFFLSGWNGDTSYTIDTIGRGSVYVEAVCLSIIGGIQPDPLRWYLGEALENGPGNDGLFQRFQVFVYPDIPRDWKYVDRLPDPNGIEEMERIFRRIAAIDPNQPLRFRFAADAQQLFIAWIYDLETNKIRGGHLHPALVSHLSKYRSLMPSLALLFALADDEKGIVPLRHAQQAAAFCNYLESHARRVYSLIISPAAQAAAELGRHLKDGWKREEGVFTVRNVYIKGWRELGTPDRVRAALEFLEDRGWVRAVEIERTCGRSTEMYAINPKLAGREK